MTWAPARDLWATRKWLIGYAALSAMASLGPAGTDFDYTGPVVSGATVGTWKHTPHAGDRESVTAVFDRQIGQIDLPLKAGLDRAQLETDLAHWLAARDAADAEGDAIKARDCSARAERARRWIARLADIPDGPDYPFGFSVTRLGDAIWIATGGEPFSLLQRALRERYPDFAVMVSPLNGNMPVAYLLEKDCYGKGLYQEEPSSLAPGCLEKLIEAVSGQMAKMA